jgi:glycosyltransferase A (GT-A) superfamily protein (DUF2064 family)
VTPRLLLTAKAPVPGLVKTRLGVEIGMDAAADVAAAALLDTIEAMSAHAGAARCHLALAGDLDDASHSEAIRAALAGWTIWPQDGEGLAVRLAHAHQQVAGPVVQVGMDTPQLSGALLAGVIDGLDRADAVLGPAEDGGWWALGLRDPSYAAGLVGVPMSAPDTCEQTANALRGLGLSVHLADRLRDVDTVADAEAVAMVAPDTRFAEAWRRLTSGVVR